MMKKLNHCILLFWLLTFLNLQASETARQFQSLEYFKKEEPQVFRFWESLTTEEKLILEDQLNEIDIETLEKQKQLINLSAESMVDSFDSFDGFESSGIRDNFLLGQELIKRGEVGCLILAGGQGTRLHYTRPKGTYPISIIKQKSLFQLIAEKVRAASVWVNRPLRLAIMTSPDNDEETRLFFQQHDYFGLLPSQISFFTQRELPFLDAQGKLFLKTPAELSKGADGNGYSLLRMMESGILNEWIKEGIQWINVILVDNPLADPFDAGLIGFHHQQGVDITLKCTEKFQPEEKVGVLVRQNGNCGVVEYSEMTSSEKNKRRDDGRLKHCCANLSLFCFSVEFIQRMSCERKTIPLHKAWKAAFYLDNEGYCQLSAQPMAWKFETFIFDWLIHAEKVAALLYPRERCFAPLKNLNGVDSPETVREAIQNREREILRSLGLTPPEFPFELSAEFYYPTPALLSKWRSCPITTSYLEP